MIKDSKKLCYRISDNLFYFNFDLNNLDALVRDSISHDMDLEFKAYKDKNGIYIKEVYLLTKNDYGIQEWLPQKTKILDETTKIHLDRGFVVFDEIIKVMSEDDFYAHYRTRCEMCDT